MKRQKTDPPPAGKPKEVPAASAAPAAHAVLDADVLAWLDEAVTAEPLDTQARSRVRQRLLRRIAADSTPRHFTVAAGEGDWQPFGTGLSMKVLHHEGQTLSYLLRLAPGASLPPHRHPCDEECLVLEGEMRIGELVVGPGSYHLGRAGVLHDELVSPCGALLFLRGAVPEIALAL